MTYDSVLHASLDFKSWYSPGRAPLQGGECPSLFPLPRRTPGSFDPLLDDAAGASATPAVAPAPPAVTYQGCFVDDQGGARDLPVNAGDLTANSPAACAAECGPGYK